MLRKFIAWLLLTGAISVSSCTNETPVSPMEPYFPKVKAIIADNCTISCHAPSKGFDDGRPVVLESDSDIVNLAQSIKRAVSDPISPMNIRMPLGGQLSASDIDIIKKWVATGGRQTD